MKNFKKIYWQIALVLLIFLFALGLRLYRLGQYPNGLLWDEAALGYNAFSILKTGRDEYGKLLPVIFKSFGDYKPGFYVYLTVPSIALFGLNEFAVRFPSAVLGALTVPLFFLLLRESFTSSSFWKAWLASLLLAISPWQINFSRGAWELNVMVSEIVAGFFFLVRYLNFKKTKYLYVSALFFLLTFFTYQAAKLLVPVLLFGFVFFFRSYIFIKSLPRRAKISFTSVVVFGFVFLNLLTLVGGGEGRLKVMSLFSYPRSAQETQLFKNQDGNSSLSWSVFHSSPVFFFRSVLGRYFNHFSGKFLFFAGDWSNPRNGIVYQGVLYYLDALFLVLGLGVLFSRKRNPLENLMLFWLVVAPLPSALTRDIISSVRAYPMVIPLTFISATGLFWLISFLSARKKIIRLPSYLILLSVYGFLFVRLLDNYFVHDPKVTAENRLFGYREMVAEIAPLVETKNKVVITTKYGQPYIFYLFYTGYNPSKYQKSAQLKENPQGDVGAIEKIDNIEFREVYWPADRGILNSVFVDDEFGLPLNDLIGQDWLTIKKEIKYPNGKIAFRIVETK